MIRSVILMSHSVPWWRHHGQSIWRRECWRILRRWEWEQRPQDWSIRHSFIYWQIKYRKGAWFLAATFNRLSKPFLPNIVRHIWLPGGDAKASVSPPIWKLNLNTPAIRHNVWQLQQIGQTIAKVFHFCPLFVSLNTSLSGNLHTFSSPFQRYPTCLISVRACCWSTVLWTARSIWRRRPGRSLTLGCINSVGIFFNEDVIQPWIHWPPWSSFPGCSRRPKCRRPPTHMSLMLSHMLEIWRKKTVRHLEQAIYE